MTSAHRNVALSRAHPARSHRAVRGAAPRARHAGASALEDPRAGRRPTRNSSSPRARRSAACPDLDVLFVPGGAGQVALMQDEEVLGFLRDAGRKARFVTAVCTGSLLLGVAGLLDGYDAATHWAFMGLLPMFGARPVRKRVVVDRNRDHRRRRHGRDRFRLGACRAALVRDRRQGHPARTRVRSRAAVPVRTS